MTEHKPRVSSYRCHALTGYKFCHSPFHTPTHPASELDVIRNVSPDAWKIGGKTGVTRDRRPGTVENRLLPGRSVDGGVSDKENGVCENGFTLKEKGS